jgi:hypothetical protein
MYFDYFLLEEETEEPRKTTDTWQVANKVYHICLYRVHLTICSNSTHSFSGDRHKFHR